MCPWREPEKDLESFFPEATRHFPELVALSSRRLQILERLGPNQRLQSNALHVERVSKGSTELGTVVVRRVSGPNGPIEVVTAVSLHGTIKGVRVQRHREPAPDSKNLQADGWLRSFVGKSANDRFEMGGDLPRVAVGADAAKSVARAVRSVMIELSEGESIRASHSH